MLNFYTFFLIAYFFSAIPSGYFIGKLHGIDLTKEGSGSTGATNVLRLVGKWQAAFVLIFDIVKGFLPVYYAKNFLPLDNEWQLLVFTILPILAHSKSIYIGFKGGKSSATSLGVILALNFWVGLIGVSIWFLVVKISGISSLGSIVSIPLIPLWLYLFGESKVVISFGFFAFVYIVLIKHRTNIQRLIKGEEYSFKKT